MLQALKASFDVQQVVRLSHTANTRYDLTTNDRERVRVGVTASEIEYPDCSSVIISPGDSYIEEHGVKMLAARDQENLTHAHQQTAAGKPLNQGVRALHPKTPGNLKTPFRTSKNDENKPLESKSQKTELRDGLSKLDKNAFATPARRDRAPLGLKTTNAKAQPFKTPAPLQQTAKPNHTVKRPSTNRRSARS